MLLLNLLINLLAMLKILSDGADEAGTANFQAIYFHI
jgi:hypothetical protein